MHESVRLVVFAEFGKSLDSLVIFTEVRVCLHELAIGDPVEQLDLLENEEINPGKIVTSDKVLGAEELRDLCHSLRYGKHS